MEYLIEERRKLVAGDASNYKSSLQVLDTTLLLACLRVNLALAHSLLKIENWCQEETSERMLSDLGVCRESLFKC